MTPSPEYQGHERRQNCELRHREIVDELRDVIVDKRQFEATAELVRSINEALLGTYDRPGMISRVKALEDWRDGINGMVRAIVIKSVGAGAGAATVIGLVVFGLLKAAASAQGVVP